MAKDTFELTSQLMKGAAAKEQLAKQHDYKVYKGATEKFSISPLYARYVGSTVTIAHNGNFKKFPVDGTQFEIPVGHLNALKKYLRSIDRQIKIAQQNAKFMGNNETGDFKKII
jgi:hypothetical protein